MLNFLIFVNLELPIANGRLGCDHSVGTFTYAGSTGSSVLDYLILNHDDFTLIDNFVVHSFCEWSDHAPLSFTLKPIVQSCSEEVEYTFSKIKWDNSLRDDFRRGIIGWRPDINFIVSNIDSQDKPNIDAGINNF